jgi:hypothetical protein
MKTNRIFSTALIIFSLFTQSCNIQKRQYSQGLHKFHIDFSSSRFQVGKNRCPNHTLQPTNRYSPGKNIQIVIATGNNNGSEIPLAKPIEPLIVIDNNTYSFAEKQHHTSIPLKFNYHSVLKPKSTVESEEKAQDLSIAAWHLSIIGSVVGLTLIGIPLTILMHLIAGLLIGKSKSLASNNDAVRKYNRKSHLAMGIYWGLFVLFIIIFAILASGGGGMFSPF